MYVCIYVCMYKIFHPMAIPALSLALAVGCSTSWASWSSWHFRCWAPERFPWHPMRRYLETSGAGI